MKPGQTFQFDLAETFPHLKNAPIVEAVIQWVARAASGLTPDDLRQQLAQRLPDYPDCQPQRSFRLGVQLELDGSSKQSAGRLAWLPLHFTRQAAHCAI